MLRRRKLKAESGKLKVESGKLKAESGKLNEKVLVAGDFFCWRWFYNQLFFRKYAPVNP
jgi:hypothetical protein